MAHHEMNNWLIGYDIANPKRLGRVFRLLKREGLPIQYSLFLVIGSMGRLETLMAKLDRLIDLQSDDIRAYRMPRQPDLITLGSSIIPEGVLYDDRVPFLLT